MTSLQNRWSFALAAFVAGGLCLPALSIIVGGSTAKALSGASISGFFELCLAFGTPAALAALICWPPRHSRTFTIMAAVGFVAVFLAILFFWTATLMHGTVLGGTPKLSELKDAIIFILSMTILSSIFTLGIPYVIGIAVSLCFIDFTPDDPVLNRDNPASVTEPS